MNEMLGFITRRDSVTFESLMVVLRREGWEEPEEAIYDFLHVMVEDGVIQKVAGKYGGWHYQLPRERVSDPNGTLEDDALRLLPMLKKSSLFKETFCAANVWNAFGNDMKLGTSGRVKYLLQYLEDAGHIILNHTKNSPGGLSKKFRLAGVEPIDPKKPAVKKVKKLVKTKKIRDPWELAKGYGVTSWLSVSAWLKKDLNLSDGSIGDLRREWLASGRLVKASSGWEIDKEAK